MNAINALMAGAGQNLRMILNKLRLLFAWLLVTVNKLHGAITRLTISEDIHPQSAL